MKAISPQPQWQGCILEDLGNIQTGRTPSKKTPEFYGGNFPLFKPSDLDPIGVVTEATEYLSDLGKENTRVVSALSTYVTCIGATIGKTAFVGVEGTCNQQINTISPNQFISPKWVYYLMISPSMKSSIISTSSSTTLPILNKSKFSQLSLELPPLAEQKVIADKLDSLLAQVETTKARLDRVPDILKRFRQSVLAAAVSGRLTEEWRECHSIEDSIHEFGCFDPKKIEEESELFHIPNTWSWQHLGDLVSVHNSVRVPLKKADRDKRSGEYAYYGAFGVIDDIDDFLFDGEFILLAEDGKNLESRQRPISLVASGKFWVNNHAHVLKAKTGVINHYLNIFLNSPVVMIDQFLTGQDQVKLNRKAMTLIPISTPSFEEQTEIVRRVEELFAFADNVEQKAQAATERVNKLTQSILAKAFRGELTADWRVANPDLISGENSAEVLLEKIKAEREALKPKKKTRAKKVKKV